MYANFQEYLKKELAQIEADGLYKRERIIESAQGAEIMVGGKVCLNFCANNYLGLADNPELIQAAKDGMDARGYGMASVRFSTRSWKPRLLSSSARKTPSSMLLASMPMAVCLNRCLVPTMPSSPML